MKYYKNTIHSYLDICNNTAEKFAILTNGITYRFYTDLEEQNKMDSSPFFEFNLLDLKESTLTELAKFRKNSFDLENIFTTASELKYLNKIKKFLNVHGKIHQMIMYVSLFLKFTMVLKQRIK